MTYHTLPRNPSANPCASFHGPGPPSFFNICTTRLPRAFREKFCFSKYVLLLDSFHNSSRICLFNGELLQECTQLLYSCSCSSWTVARAWKACDMGIWLRNGLQPSARLPRSFPPLLGDDHHVIMSSCAELICCLGFLMSHDASL